MQIAKTAPDALKLLWKAKLFLKPQGFENVKLDLEKKGYNFGDDTLKKALQRSKFLTLRGKTKGATYVQKYPYFEEEANEKQ